MGSGGAARRRQEREQEPPPDPVAESVAEIGRIISGSDAVRQKIGRHERAIAAEVRRMRQLAADCPDAERLAASADNLAARVAPVVVELIAVAAQDYEARQALERCTEAIELRAASASFTEAQRAAAFEAGRQAGIAEEQARASGAPRSRPAHRKRRFQVVGGIAAGSAVAAASLAAGTVIASQDSAVVHHWSPGPASVRLHAGPADSAVLVPSSSPRSSYVPKHARPSADAASASPAPSPSLPAAASPSPSVSVPQPSAAVSGVLNVQTVTLAIGPDGTGKITFTAVGGEVEWQASVSSLSPDLSLSDGEGLLADGQPGVITVNVRAGALAGTGTVTLTDGNGTATQVAVTWVALPAL